MSISYFEYKGHVGSIEPDIENGNLFGKVSFIRDLITYEAVTLKELEQEFHFSVDEYLADCESLNKQPDRPFKGSFNVRTGSELHREAALAAKEQSLNAFICEAIKEKLERLNT